MNNTSDNNTSDNKMGNRVDNKVNNDNMINNILNELSENKVIDIKAVKTQLDRLYAYKYNVRPKINIKCFDEIIMVYGIVYKQGVAKPIRFDYRVFEYLNKNKNDIFKWIVNYKGYTVSESENEKSEISTFDIFKLNVNNYNSNLIVEINANNIDTFEHEEIPPYFIRISNFVTLMKNIGYISKLINETIEKK